MEEQLLRLRQLHNAPLVNNSNPVRDEPHHRQIVGDEQVRQPAADLQPVEQVEHLGPDGHVQRGDGLVGHHKLRLHNQRPGNADTLTLAAGELVGEPGGKLRQQAHFPQRVLHLPLPVILVLVEVVVDEALGDDVVHLGPLVQRGHGVLEDHLALLDDLQIQLLGDLPADPAALEEDLAGGHRVDAGDCAANGGLARAGLAHQGEGLPLVDVDVDMVNGDKLFPATSEGNLQVLDLYQLFTLWHSKFPPLLPHLFTQLFDGRRLLDLGRSGV